MRIARTFFLLTLSISALSCQFTGHENGELEYPLRTIAGPDLAGLMLTWQEDPSTTMTIDWHSFEERAVPVLEYRRRGRRPWNSVVAESIPFPFSDRIINRAHLTGLQPESIYEFRFTGSGGTFRFRTMPLQLTRDILFAAGGDTMHNKEWFDETNLQAARHDIDFVVFAGDLAYADGRPELIQRWYQWMESVTNTLVRPDRRVIPVLVTLGNHEVRHSFYDRVPEPPETDAERRHAAPFFFELFAAPGQPGYDVLDFGDYLSLFLLDSHHINAVEGHQLRWLRAEMQARRHVTHVIPAYHVPAYPSVRSFNDPYVARVRSYWVPVFEENGVRLSIEAHDHAYKRTRPIRGNQEDPSGIVYIGDGAWGVNTREIGTFRSTPNIWYLAHAEPTRHFILVTLKPTSFVLEAFDQNGDRFDHFDVHW